MDADGTVYAWVAIEVKDVRTECRTVLYAVVNACRCQQERQDTRKKSTFCFLEMHLDGAESKRNLPVTLGAG
jgi:hypothetical protein